MTGQEFPAGHVFFRQGDPADRAYQLLDGQVEVLAGVDQGGAGSDCSQRVTCSARWR
jgi:CRP-like cAMP-binding protein